MTAERATELFAQSPLITACDLTDQHLDMLVCSPVPMSMRNDVAMATDALHLARIGARYPPHVTAVLDRVVAAYNRRVLDVPRLAEQRLEARIERGLRDLGRTHRPRQAWKAEVWRRIERRRRIDATVITALWVLAAVTVGTIAGLVIFGWWP
jgi:hypothetical protein